MLISAERDSVSGGYASDAASYLAYELFDAGVFATAA